MFAVIRIRGNVHLKERIKRTLALLNLNRVNRLAIVPENEQYKKMLKKVENYITWGEINTETLAKLLEKRGCISLRKGISMDYLKEKKLNSFKELAEKIEKGSSLRELGLKPFFALKPPSKGFERAGIKKAYSIGGALGYRGKDINVLIERML